VTQDHTFLRQFGERAAHRRAADAEPLAEFVLGRETAVPVVPTPDDLLQQK
jgi:hypothetical protein